jgi:hypothetical protein
MNMKSAISILVLSQMLTQPMAVSRVVQLQIGSTKVKSSSSAPQCEIVETSALTITCAYAAASTVGADGRAVPRIILNRTVISFVPSDESQMRVELSFTNGSGNKIADQRTVYLAIDDERGENHMRRPLPHVDFTQLEPGKLTKFLETLVAPAFTPGQYTVSIWIPSTDSNSKFDPTHNFLLSSAGVSVPATGLNTLAKFTVHPSAARRSGAKPK